MSVERYFETFDERVEVVQDMLDDMHTAMARVKPYGIFGRNKSLVRKSEKNANTSASGIVFSVDMMSVCEGRINAGVELSLTPEDTAHDIRQIAAVAGNLSMARLVSTSLPLNRPWAKVDDSVLSITEYIYDVWSPDYADRMANAVHLGITRDLVEVDK